MCHGLQLYFPCGMSQLREKQSLGGLDKIFGYSRLARFTTKEWRFTEEANPRVALV